MKMIAPCANRSSLLLIAFSVFLFSCTGMKAFREDRMAARDKTYKNFIQTSDGTIYEVDAVVFRNPLFGKSTVEIGNGQKVNTKEILAYQDNNAYYRRVNGQLAPRTKKGFINMYVTSETYTQYETNSSNVGGGRWTTRTRYVNWLQKGDDAEVVRYSVATLEEYVQDYQPAYDYILEYKRQQKKSKMWSAINTTVTLGGLALVCVDGSKESTKVSGAGYTGLALMAGGLTSGIVNKIKKGKNRKNLELALDTYNSPRPKKRK